MGSRLHPRRRPSPRLPNLSGDWHHAAKAPSPGGHCSGRLRGHDTETYAATNAICCDADHQRHGSMKLSVHFCFPGRHISQRRWALAVTAL